MRKAYACSAMSGRNHTGNLRPMARAGAGPHYSARRVELEEGMSSARPVPTLVYSVMRRQPEHIRTPLPPPVL